MSRETADDRVGMISGVPFAQIGVGQDTVRCQLCGQVVDVGGEIRAHIREHQALQMEQWEEERR